MTSTLVEEASRVEEEGSHVMAVLDKTGDTRIIWDPDVPEEVASAQRTFDELKKKGYSAFSVNRKGDKDKVVRTFDKDAEKLILAPALVGG
jgi:monomeric isocitrate dehydrogenase